MVHAQSMRRIACCPRIACRARRGARRWISSSTALPSPAAASATAWTADPDTGVISSKHSDMPQFQTVIGLEIHAQLKIATKLFSDSRIPAKSSLTQAPNSSISPFDLGVPGYLPRLSQEAVQKAVLTAAATKCDIPHVSRFERKHYFYADLPLGYQVTQQRWPLAKDGELVCQMKQAGGKNKNNKQKNNNNQQDSFRVGIERIQIEQDTGKTTSSTSASQGQTESLVDFNRAGSALIEIVFRPDLRSANAAAATVETLRDLLVHIGTCDGKMEEGSLRCDLNVSIAPVHDDDTEILLQRTGNRVEVKNLNSLRQIVQAAQFEGKRQAQAYVNDEPTSQETRTFDVRKAETVVIRSKEGAKDYRFMPEPDIPPIVLDEDMFDGLQLQDYVNTTLPELPEDARNRLVSTYGLSEYLATVITGDPPAIALFDEAVARAADALPDVTSKKVASTVANFLCNELFSLIRETQMRQMHDGTQGVGPYSLVSGEQLGQLSVLFLQNSISNTMAKHIIHLMYEKEHDQMPSAVADKYGYRLITDEEELRTFCRAVIDANPDELDRYKMGGKFARKITKFYQGKSMALSRGTAQPERLNEILLEVLEEVAPGVEQ